jgi:hypothetical protein
MEYAEKLEATNDTVRLDGGMQRWLSSSRKKGGCSKYIVSRRK